VYSKGALQAEEISVVGGVIGGDAGTFRDVNLVGDPALSRIQINIGGSAGPQNGFFSEKAVGYHLDASGRILDQQDWGNLRVDARQFAWEIVGDRIRLVCYSGGQAAQWEGPASDMNQAAISVRDLCFGPGRGGRVGLNSAWFGPVQPGTNDTSIALEYRTEGTGAEATRITVDPSQFLKLEDRIRVYLWNES
jgi:hypothetical protein